jgi:hypothetical protein
LEIDITYTEPQNEIYFKNHDCKYLIVPKGRRFGTTKGAANAFIEYAIDNITPLLWVDTINGNIDRYYDRYFYPVLKQIPSNKWNFNRQKRELKIYDSIIDFRSADSPESIEGFGYKKIFLNEAGIILKNDYLYSNAILPMLLDYKDSQLIASGVPKGKTLKSGKKHKFYELYERCINNEVGYRLLHYTSYDNPLIDANDIKNLGDSMTAQEYNQEILGQFIDSLGENPFLHTFKAESSTSNECTYLPDKQLIISVDFNLNPFCVTFHHYWQSADGQYHHHIFDEAEIKNGSIQAMAELIKLRYKNSLPNCILTGDAMGNRGDISQRDNASSYLQLIRYLGISERQLKVSSNPTHENSRSDCNYYVYHFKNFKISKQNCPNTIRDFLSVQCDAFGSILKRNRNDVTQLADYLDTFRYFVNNIAYKWIELHQKNNKFA